MTSAYSRRRLLSMMPVAGVGAWALLAGCKADAGSAPKSADATADRLAALEKRAGGRLGVAFLDSATGRTASHRGGERFAMCSTFKWPLSAVILKAVEGGKLMLDQPVPYGVSDLLEFAPVTRANVATGSMTVAELMEATITTSDNTAANLLLGLIGGPAGATRQFRAWGDAVTRLDRLEPEMNDVVAGDERDTTSPTAMAGLLRAILVGDALSPTSRALLIDWGVATETGYKRLRAGLPSDWRSGDKTGTGVSADRISKYNDIAITYPPKGPPILIAAYYESPVISSQKMRDEDQAVLAEVGRIAAEWAAG